MGYNMPLLEAVGLTLTGKNFNVATAFMGNEQATIYRWSGLMLVIEDVFSKSYHMLCRRHIDQNLLAKLTEMIKDEEVASRQIAEIKYSLAFSKHKEKFSEKSNPILKNISNNIIHLALKKILLEIKRACEIIDDLLNKCGHYLRKSHGLLCSCELIGQYEHLLPLKLEDVSVFWKTLEIGIRDLASLLDQISTGPISKIREVHRVLSPVLVEDPGAILTTPPEHAVTKGQRKTNSTKKDKSYSKHVSTARRKIRKSSGSGSDSDSTSGSGFGSRRRGRPPRAPRDGCLLPPLHVQWQYHRDIQVSGWAETYSERIAYWNTRYRAEVPPRDPIHVNY
ncbi:hypothetical protein M9H77_02788 [Catharanthus roseus]|uniref:Uncharacterized protein n=1 Tax=Catharanthus roseus TaxID=4058 RepID=A0ACC0C9D6_CATRO|nr:hypothetical protein M9H77_02788 [Catharanthus roseus]